MIVQDNIIYHSLDYKYVMLNEDTIPIERIYNETNNSYKNIVNIPIIFLLWLMI